MRKSSLTNCIILSPNHSGKRTHKMDRITPHCVVGQLSAESIGHCFDNKNRKASCNYGIGKEGRVCLVVDEDNRSWCTSSNSNDQRAITIECASDSKHPYTFTDACYNKLIDLTVDICKRYNKTKLVWISNKEKALAYKPKDNELQITVHRWFADKSCPGDWMMSKMNDYVNKVNSKLTSEVKPVKHKINNNTNNNLHYQVKVTASTLNYRKGPGINYDINGTITNKGIYTIIEESNGWGKLKSGEGWISLKYTKKL